MIPTEQILTQGIMTLAMTSGWILVVLLLRRPVARWLGARWAYRLWLLPLICLLSMAIPAYVLYPLRELLALPLPDISKALAVAHGVASLPIASLLLTLWITGTAVAAFRTCFLLWRQSRALQLTSRSPSHQERNLLLKQCVKLPGLQGSEIRMLESNSGPALCGLLRPVLYLPCNFFTQYDPTQQRLMLQHEHLHVGRHDVHYLMLARLFRCVFWFNPLVWLAERQLQADQELSCDAHVLQRANSATRRLYGETLLQAAQKPLGAALVHYSAAFAQLLQRTLMLKEHRNRALAGVAGMVLLTSANVFAVWGGLTASQTSQDNIGKDLRVTLAELYGLLECGNPDRLALQDILGQIDRLAASAPPQPFNKREIAQLHSLSALTHQRLGNYPASLGAYQEAARLIPDERVLPVQAHCNLAGLWTTPPPVPVTLADGGISAFATTPLEHAFLTVNTP